MDPESESESISTDGIRFGSRDRSEICTERAAEWQRAAHEAGWCGRVHGLKFPKLGERLHDVAGEVAGQVSGTLVREHAQELAIPCPAPALPLRQSGSAETGCRSRTRNPVRNPVRNSERRRPTVPLRLPLQRDKMPLKQLQFTALHNDMGKELKAANLKILLTMLKVVEIKCQ